MACGMDELRLEGAIKRINGVAFAVDIGGTLAKLAYYAVHKRRALSIRREDNETETTNHDGETLVVQEQDVDVGRLHLCYFPTSDLENCIRFIKSKMGSLDSSIVRATGGGAHKYSDMFLRHDLTFHKLDEMECLVRGCNYLLKSVQDEAFTFSIGDIPSKQFNHPRINPFPYLLVNIGSGVSIIKVDSDHSFERVDGSALGGGTFWGLGSLLTGSREFDDILKLAQQGNCQNIDMLVGDIYGDATPRSLGLDPNLTASCFGKARRAASDLHDERRLDAAASLLQMIAFNIAQISCLNARLYKITRVYFAGFFIRAQPCTMHTITQAVKYWGRGNITPLFLRHEGYVGAVGSFLGGMSQYKRDTSSKCTDTLPEAVQEQFSIPQTKFGPLKETFNFELQHEEAFVPFPLLLDPVSYKADSIDLMQDISAREYWLQCFKDSIDREYQRAVNCGMDPPTQLKQRATAFKISFLSHMDVLSSDPSIYGELSVRIILELRQQCLREFGFGDIYSTTKRTESEGALQFLPEILAEMDTLNPYEEIFLAIYGALAGNCFDWGAAAVAKRMDHGEIDFFTQRKRLEESHFLRNDIQAFTNKFETSPWKHVVMFVDNAGADVVLGMLPLARTFLKHGCRVTIAANSYAVLNDITFTELAALLRATSKFDSTIANAVEIGTLQAVPNGSGSPCIDLSRISYRLAQQSFDADLVILEGMGRAIHTNYDVELACDTLKLAMLKNAWLAEKLGGKLYDVVCRFDQNS